MPDPVILTVVFATFLLAGVVKGVIGLGLPTVSLALLTVALDLPSAMALLLVPSLLTNLWQAVSGGNSLRILRRLWPFLMAATVSVAIGGLALSRVDASWLAGLLGLLLVAYATVGLLGYRLSIGARRQPWAGPVLGAINGILTGMTGSCVGPGVVYLQAIGLPRDMLIQAMGMLFTASTVALAAALHGNDMLSAKLGGLSVAAVGPAILGMCIGQRVRQRLAEHRFRQIFFWSLLLLGIYIGLAAIG